MIAHANPVVVDLSANWLASLRDAVADRSVVLITSPSFVANSAVSRISEVLQGSLACVRSDVRPNPTLRSIEQLSAGIPECRDSVVVALGGGSTIDTAKGVRAIFDRGSRNSGWLSAHLRNGAPFPEGFAPLPLIAVPTTSGSGSEVTKWATIWDESSFEKHSLCHDSLYPEMAIHDFRLTLSLPRATTLYSALDALSHSMESLWSLGSTPQSEAHACYSIRLILKALPEVMQNPHREEARRELHKAALLGGLAISQTRTAGAHSISYPLTARFGMPHGLACSFTLPELARFYGGANERVSGLLRWSFESESLGKVISVLRQIFLSLSVGTELVKYVGDPRELSAVRGRLTTPGRSDNGTVPLEEDTACAMLERAFKKATGGSV